MKPDVVPDVTGVIVGWRAWWRLDVAWPKTVSRLCSLIQYEEWDLGIKSAICESMSHSAPQEDCVCGIYACKELRYLLDGCLNFVILGLVQRSMKRAGHADRVKEFMAEATAGDYDHLLRTCMKWVEVE